ncbi:MAG: hypothetical protein LBE82_08250 [Chitinophagaceae bacterium]|nr:hypothetical protein [Chitinophagaceae bacterium]
MNTGLLHVHNFLRWVILILLLVNIIRNYANANKPFSSSDKKLSLFLMIAAHLTLLVGLYQWLFGRYSFSHIPAGVNIMKDDFWRFYVIEHPFGMIVSIVLITVGNSFAKKKIADRKKHSKMGLFFLLALIIILITVPWPFREIVGRPLIP